MADTTPRHPAMPEMSPRALAAWATGEPWLIHGPTLDAYLARLPLLAAVWPGFSEPGADGPGGNLAGTPSGDGPDLDVREGGVAVIPIKGPTIDDDTPYGQFMAWAFGACRYVDIRRSLSGALNRADVRAIVLDVDSPGGMAKGCAEAADAIRDAARAKPTAAYISGNGTSAAYWLASAAGEVAASRSATVGSIGVVCVGRDDRKFQDMIGVREIPVVSTQSPLKWKPPWEEDGLAEIQSLVDAKAAVFIATIAEFRAVTPDYVVANFGRGGSLVGDAARKAGMVDRVGTFGETLAKMAGPNRGRLAIVRPTGVAPAVATAAIASVAGPPDGAADGSGVEVSAADAVAAVASVPVPEPTPAGVSARLTTDRRGHARLTLRPRP